MPQKSRFSPAFHAGIAGRRELAAVAGFGSIGWDAEMGKSYFGEIWIFFLFLVYVCVCVCVCVCVSLSLSIYIYISLCIGIGIGIVMYMCRGQNK